MASSSGYRVEAVATETWAKENADDLDNAFGNILRGNDLDGFTVVLYDGDGEVLASEGFEDSENVDDAVERVLAEQNVDRADVESVDVEV